MREFVIIVAEVIGALFVIATLAGLVISILPSANVRKLLAFLQRRGIINPRA